MSHEPHDKLLPDDGTQPRRPGLVPVREGQWAGWYHYEPADAFEDYTGPFHCRPDADGSLVCGFMPEPKNCNAGGNIHGGSLMTFADYALFMIAGGMDSAVHGVTVTCNCEFVGAAEAGNLLTARGEVVRAGFSMIFVRGLISDGERPVMAFSGTIKRIAGRPQVG
jgi:uncharacterized protein (TIGR00369 family)